MRDPLKAPGTLKTMFAGNLVAIVTPMRRDGAVDFDAWTRLVDFHLQNGTHGIVVGGTTGESPTITEAELRELTERACAQVAKRIPIIVGTGTSNTAATVVRTRWVSELPVDGVLVVTPSYNKPPQEGLFRHFAAVAEASRVPIILYNIPGRTAVDLLPATVARLMQFPRIVCIKEGLASIERVRELVALSKPGFTVLSGDDATAREAIFAGAKGVISVTANVAPRLMSDMVTAAGRGEKETADRLDARMAALHRDLFVETNPIPTKWALTQMGLIESGVRLPLTELAPAYHSVVTAALKAAGVEF
jgi:4-hydroxy-tetrahydrodipicolinate synthase